MGMVYGTLACALIGVILYKAAHSPVIQASGTHGRYSFKNSE